MQQNLSAQLQCHVLAYAEMLLAWGLPEKRTELLKSVEKAFLSTVMDSTVFDNAIAGDRLGTRALMRGPMTPADSLLARLRQDMRARRTAERQRCEHHLRCMRGKVAFPPLFSVPIAHKG